MFNLSLLSIFFLTFISFTYAASPQFERRADFDPTQISVVNNMPQPNMNKVVETTWIASAASCSIALLTSWSCKSCQQVPNTKFYTSFSNSKWGTFGFIAIDDTQASIYLVFRGSKNFANYLANLDTAPKPFLPASQSNVTVHSGFLNSMESLYPSFSSVIISLLSKSEYSQYKIIVTGHSLGGAMASLAAAKLKSSLNLSWDQLALYTYGQPRTGNQAFAMWYDNKPISTARVVNYNDAIPHMPASSTSYVHHNNELYINSQKQANYCNSNVLEDGNCSYNVPQPYSNNAHMFYFDTNMSEDTSC